MDKLPNCPTCNSEYTYEDANFLICPECFYEWQPEGAAEDKADVNIIKDEPHAEECKCQGIEIKVKYRY